MLSVFMLPCENLQGDIKIWLVVDILRATSQIITFFSGGGEILIPVTRLEDAYALRAKYGEEYILMGERNALRPEGFITGNSPLELLSLKKEYRRKGIICTTNGTHAVLAAHESGGEVIAAGMLNATAAVDYALKISDGSDNIGILCSGRGGNIGLDDIICAGFLADKILKRRKPDKNDELQDGTAVALNIYNIYKDKIKAGILTSQHARILVSLGYEEDINYCCTPDLTQAVPRLVKLEGGDVAFVQSE